MYVVDDLVFVRTGRRRNGDVPGVTPILSWIGVRAIALRYFIEILFDVVSRGARHFRSNPRPL
jgi:hypothetical protein